MILATVSSCCAINRTTNRRRHAQSGRACALRRLDFSHHRFAPASEEFSPCLMLGKQMSLYRMNITGRWYKCTLPSPDCGNSFRASPSVMRRNQRSGCVRAQRRERAHAHGSPRRQPAGNQRRGDRVSGAIANALAAESAGARKGGASERARPVASTLRRAGSPCHAPGGGLALPRWVPRPRIADAMSRTKTEPRRVRRGIPMRSLSRRS
jgi:hypothetical protein